MQHLHEMGWKSNPWKNSPVNQWTKINVPVKGSADQRNKSEKWAKLSKDGSSHVKYDTYGIRLK